MSAQTNDPLSAFAYPQDPGNTTPTTSSPVTSPIASTPNQTDENTSVEPQRGNEILGLDPVVQTDVNSDLSVSDSVVQVDANLDPSTIETLTDVDSNSNSNSNQSVSEPGKDIPQEDEKDEKKESPLQALARKLSKLREELVQEVPAENTLSDQAVVEEKTDSSLVESKPENEVTEDILSTSDLPNMSDLSQSSETSQQPETSMVDNLSLNTPLPELDTATLEPPVNLDGSTEVASVEPEVSEVTADPLDLLKEAEKNVLENSKPQIDEIKNLDEISANDALDISSPVDSTIAEVNPDMIAPDLNTPSMSSTDTTKDIALDENDNSMVSPETVEVASVGSKYPLSINKIMEMAIERNASDIQVSVGYPVMIRIDGTLIEANPQVVSNANAEELIMPVLSEQKKELLEVNREVDLAYSPLKQNAQARFRINAYYSKGNLTAAFRLIPARIRTIEELMLPPIYNQLIKLAQGLVLVTGPTGHGKSTTLAAMLQAINTSRAVHMITIEDPIEYMFKPEKAVVDQREMHDDTHSWTVALKSALRQDPDVILVGEMRDYETIAATITLAETGHLVFATLHTNSAAQTVDRIIDVFPENQQAQIRTQLANILEAVIAQRLLPIDGGGRRAVSEIMLGTPAVRNLIREGKTHQLDNVIRTSADVGMFSLEQSLIRLVRDGLITMERAQEYAVHPEEVVRLLKT